MQSRIRDDTENECYLCGKQGNMEVHHIFEGSTRGKSDEYRLIIHVCRKCHDKVHSKDGNKMREYLHQKAQRVYEEEIGTREQFIKDFILSYL